ncbi:MAG: hypothetical protein II525_05135, partial [Bacteroidales bacterium]|nr:hypothetical protein [Bacteroidales bacterium]
MKKKSVLILGIVSLMFMSCSHVEKTYYPSGGIESEVSFWGGKMDGKAVWYYENGSIRMEVEYVKGRLHGPCVRYYRNGKPAHKQSADFEGNEYWQKNAEELRRHISESEVVSFDIFDT